MPSLAEQIFSLDWCGLEDAASGIWEYPHREKDRDLVGHREGLSLAARVLASLLAPACMQIPCEEGGVCSHAYTHLSDFIPCAFLCEDLWVHSLCVHLYV